jgi:uncharacterized protein
MYPDPYIEYLAHFHGDQDFFECHEILEEYWKEVDFGNKESIWVAFIQLSVGCYHFRRGNAKGAARILKKSLTIFKSKEELLPSFGIDSQTLFTNIENLIEEACSGKSFKGFSIPIEDEQLRNLWKMECLRKGHQTENAGYIPPKAIIDRHSTRDRTSVILEREQALMLRKEKERRK